MVHPTMEDGIPQDLRALHDAYTRKINYLVGENREDLIREIVDAYTEEASQLMATVRPEDRGSTARSGNSSLERG
jgi:hypothetical protein